MSYHCSLFSLTNKFRNLKFRHIPRIRNIFVDTLPTCSSMIWHPDELVIEPIQIQVQEKPAYCLIVKNVSDDHSYYSNIKQFIKRGSYLPGVDLAIKSFLHRMSSKFFLYGEVLYKKTSNFSLLRCIDREETEYMMKEVHNGVCRPHMNGHLLAKKITRTEYFWLAMECDCIDFVRKCVKYQMHGDTIRAPPIELHSMIAPWPCSMWGIDVIGAIDPPVSNMHRFILVTIENFAKWIKTISYKHVTKK